MDIFSDKFSELTEVFSKITEMANIVENLTKTEEQINNKK
jgi:hypothetical protein